MPLEVGNINLWTLQFERLNFVCPIQSSPKQRHVEVVIGLNELTCSQIRLKHPVTGALRRLQWKNL